MSPEEKKLIDLEFSLRVFDGPSHTRMADELMHDAANAICSLRQQLAERSRASSASDFCDSNCTWMDHHPDCAIGSHPAPAGGAATGCWHFEVMDFQQALYATEPDGTVHEIWHSEFGSLRTQRLMHAMMTALSSPDPLLRSAKEPDRIEST